MQLFNECDDDDDDDDDDDSNANDCSSGIQQ